MAKKYIKPNIINMDEFYSVLSNIIFKDEFSQSLFGKKDNILKNIFLDLKNEINQKNKEKIKIMAFYKWFNAKGIKSILDINSKYIKENEEEYYFKYKEELENKLLFIKEYIDNIIDDLIEKNLIHKIKLNMFTSDDFDNIYERANLDFCKRIQKESAIGIDHENNIIQYLNNDFKIVQLNTEADLDYEGWVLGHCIGEGVLDKEIKNKNSSKNVISLRKDFFVKDIKTSNNIKRSIPFASMLIENYHLDDENIIHGEIVSIDGRGARKIKYYLGNSLDKDDTYKGNTLPFVHSEPITDDEIENREEEVINAFNEFIFNNELILCGNINNTPFQNSKASEENKEYSVQIKDINDIEYLNERNKRIVVEDSSMLHNLENIDNNHIIKVKEWEEKEVITIEKNGVYDCNNLKELKVLNILCDKSKVYCYNNENLEEINTTGGSSIYYEKEENITLNEPIDFLDLKKEKDFVKNM